MSRGRAVQDSPRKVLSAEGIPQELRDRPQWVGWKLVHKPGAAKPTKVPVDVKTGGPARTDDPATWAEFATAFGAAEAGNCDGVGYVFSADDPYVGIDLDDAIDPATGEIDPDAAAVVDRFRTYTELSQSRCGLHLILRGSLAGITGGEGRKRQDRECYDRGRFFVMTGDVASEHGIEDRQTELDEWHPVAFPPKPTPTPAVTTSANWSKLDLSDTDLIDRIRKSKQGPKFSALWSGDTTGYASGSEADLALCSILAFWTQRDADRVDRLFRSSGLIRDKWDRKRGESTYGKNTIGKVMASDGAGYDPEYRSETGVKLKLHGQTDGGDDQSIPETPDDVARIADLKRAGAEVKWVWPGWIQRGVLTAIAAEGGTGKTRFTADITRRVCHALPWPDGTPNLIESGHTAALWVVADNHHDEMVSLADAFGIADKVAVNAAPADPYGGVTLELMDDFALLEKRISIVKPVFVVIDTVGNATDKNLSKQEDAKAFFQPLQIIARRQNVAILCLTHLNSGGKVLGRRALEKVRTCIRLSAERVNDAGCKRRIEVLKSNSKYPDPLGVVMGDRANEYDDEPPPPPEEREGGEGVSVATRECAEWLASIVKDGPKPVGAIREQAEGRGTSSKTLYAAKDYLRLSETKCGTRKYWGLVGQVVSPERVVLRATYDES